MMKTFTFSALVALMSWCIVSCCCPPSPGGAFECYMTKMKNRDFKGCAQCIAIDETMTAVENAQVAQRIESLLSAQADRVMKEKGGLKNAFVKDEAISDDGNSAMLRVEYIYGDSTRQEHTQEMVRQNGQWKVKLPSPCPSIARE
ncbi:MAG: DUF4878 domain-containing protein [Muribaculaceae bacterium]|nr:DUF4878 domain-containing protein [Muribaculaceae bacterium]